MTLITTCHLLITASGRKRASNKILDRYIIHRPNLSHNIYLYKVNNNLKYFAHW